MIVDYLRTGRRQWARLYRDRPDVLTRIRWYRAAPNALQLPISHTFGFVIYDDPVRFEQQVLPGFQGAIDHFAKGVNHGQPGTSFDGPANSFLHGALFSDPRLPNCVNWVGEYRGRFKLHASWEQLEIQGRIKLHGSWSDLTDVYAGSLVLSGTEFEDIESYRGRLVLHGTWEDVEVFIGFRAGLQSDPPPGDLQAVLEMTFVEYDSGNFLDGGGTGTATVPFTGVYLLGYHCDVLILGGGHDTLGINTLVDCPNSSVGDPIVTTAVAAGGLVEETLQFAEEFELTAGDTFSAIVEWGIINGSATVALHGRISCEYRGPVP